MAHKLSIKKWGPHLIFSGSSYVKQSVTGNVTGNNKYHCTFILFYGDKGPLNRKCGLNAHPESDRMVTFSTEEAEYQSSSFIWQMMQQVRSSLTMVGDLNKHLSCTKKLTGTGITSVWHIILKCKTQTRTTHFCRSLHYPFIFENNEEPCTGFTTEA